MSDFVTIGPLELIPGVNFLPGGDDDREGQRSLGFLQQVLHVLCHLRHELGNKRGVGFERARGRPEREEAPQAPKHAVGVWEGRAIAAKVTVERGGKALELRLHSLLEDLEAVLG